MKIRKAILLFAVCALMIGCCACSQAQGGTDEETKTAESSMSEEELKEQAEKDAVSDVLNNFSYACQSNDVDAMLNCLNPSFSESLKSGRLLLNWMSTENNVDEAIMDAMVISLMQISDISAKLNTLDIKIQDIELDEGNAVVMAALTVETNDSKDSSYESTVEFSMHKENDNIWYIGGVKEVKRNE